MDHSDTNLFYCNADGKLFIVYNVFCINRYIYTDIYTDIYIFGLISFNVTFANKTFTQNITMMDYDYKFPL